MILVFGGTTEGRRTASLLEKSGTPFYYSTKGDFQEIDLIHGIRLTGAMDADCISSFCRDNSIRMIIDAAHPFAVDLHHNIATAGKSNNIPVVRFERIYEYERQYVEICQDYLDCVNRIVKSGCRKVVILTGIQTISKYIGLQEKCECWWRILNREDSYEKAKSLGIEDERLLKYGEESLESIIKRLRPDAIVTKESGKSGATDEKIEIAHRHGLRCYMISRPELPEGFIVVEGEVGLRKEIQKIVPDFFPLKIGFTTGTCAAAAVHAAVRALVTGDVADRVSVTLPSGERLMIDISKVEMVHDEAEAVVVKDGGSDPDVTDGYEIHARIRLTEDGKIRISGGKGVGRVTMPGLSAAVGEAAINEVPRRMIETEIKKYTDKGADVEISVPGGEELASKTFNPRLGITGGISIIGTSGIVQPFSNDAFVGSVAKELDVVIASGQKEIVLNSGARSEKVLRDYFYNLPPYCFIHYGNLIGETLRLCDEKKISKVALGLMIGKAVKFAEGHEDTHSSRITFNIDFILSMASVAGYGDKMLHRIGKIKMARELWSLSQDKERAKLMGIILRKCRKVARESYRSGRLDLLLITDDGQIGAILPDGAAEITLS